MPAFKHRILRRFTLLTLLLFSLCTHLYPQAGTKGDASSKSQATYGVKVNSIFVNAAVTDKSGNPVTDLTARDFRVTDDGKPQNIQTFALDFIDPTESEEVKVSAATPKPQREAIKQNAPRPRLISIVIDDLTMEAAPGPGSIMDFPRLADAMRKFIKEDIGPTDQVAILSGSRNVQFPFTDNKQRLLEELDSVPRKLNTSWAFRDMPDYLAWIYANDFQVDPMLQLMQKQGEWRKIAAIRQNAEIQSRTRNLLYAIRQHLRTLRHFEGVKMVVLFSDGFITQVGRRTGAAEAHQLQELVDLALHSGIILNTVSTRGLSSDEGGLSADVDITPPANLDDGREGEVINFSIPDEMDRMMQEKPMEQIAFETGGQFFSRSNDMHIELQSIVHRRHSCYVLTYAMPPHRSNGAYHHINLEVTRPGLELSYRKGYYSPDEEVMFENSKKEDLLEALNDPGNMNEIPMALSYNFSREDDSTYAVSFITNVNIRGLQFAEENDRRKNQISLVLVALDETDHFISGLEKSIDFQLQESSYAGLREHGLKSRVELKLPIGRYKIKAVVRENAQGKMGSIAKSVEIP